jgi:hypothetical protein
MEFKHLVERLPAGHDLGCVTVILCRDAEATDAVELLEWATGQARLRNFSVTSMIGRGSTKDAVRATMEYLAS